MNDLQRKEFWNVLLSLNGNDKKADQAILNNTIECPPNIYRYRPINTNSLEALRTNLLYFSTANYYDDPFDTFIHVDIKGLENIADQMARIEDHPSITTYIKTMFQSALGWDIPESEITNMICNLKKRLSEPMFLENVKQFFRNIRNEIKKDVWSVCFSENGLNEVLWLKYAQQHQGFVLQYDLSKPEKLLCGTQDKCKNCSVPSLGTPIYPVYYSNDHYDGTRFAQFIATCMILGLTPDMPQYNILLNAMGNMNWERERITLIKKECHLYDQEWRIILNGCMKGPVIREWIPEAVILGLNIKPAERNLVISLAKEAGIEKIYDAIIDDAGKMATRELSF